MSAAVLDFRQIIQPKAGYTLGNPSEKQVEFDCGGNTYVIPGRYEDWSAKNPDLYGGGPGTLRIYGTSQLASKDIVIHAVGPDGRTGKLGFAGVRVLFGDERDEMVWAEATEALKEAQYKTDLQIQYAHQKAVSVAKEAGQPIPAPDAKVREAMARVAEFQAANGVNSPYQCQDCGWPCFSPDQLNSHQISSHQGQAVSAAPVASSSSAEVAALTAQVAALTNLVTSVLTAPKNKGGRPRKDKEPAE